MSPKSASEPMGIADLAGLRGLAEAFNDVMKLRVGVTNRFERAPIHPDSIAPLREQLEEMEKVFKKTLLAEYRRNVPVPILAWQKETLGLGDHTFARLLGHLQHPVHATPKHWVGSGKDNRVLTEGEPFDRTVGQLWSYCGLGDPSRKRKRGMDAAEALAAGSPAIRSIMFVIAEGCKKQARSPYRAVYDACRVKYAEHVHDKPCPPCGKTGHPAPEGSPWKKGHQQGAALEVVAKAILKDLWLASVEGRDEAIGRAQPNDAPPPPPSARRKKEEAA
ncbi:MAG TPA: hypothetical protein VNL71_21545 [Chloroflexota bacterium]|nr:hypothetical protein [Chloroflexota bacterium]